PPLLDGGRGLSLFLEVWHGWVLRAPGRRAPRGSRRLPPGAAAGRRAATRRRMKRGFGNAGVPDAGASVAGRTIQRESPRPAGGVGGGGEADRPRDAGRQAPRASGETPDRGRPARPGAAS